jgi:hypothetical protein
MQVLFLQFGAFLFGLLGGPDFSFLLALHCDDFGLELFFFLFEDCLMGFPYGLDVLVVCVALLSDAVLQIVFELLDGLVQLLNDLLVG